MFIDDSCKDAIDLWEQIPEERRPYLVIKQGSTYRPKTGTYYLVDSAPGFPALLKYDQELSGYLYEAVIPILKDMEYPKLIGSAQLFNPQTTPGDHNALLAGKQIDGAIIQPGVEFSFYQYVTPSEEAGYQEGLTLYETEDGPQWLPDIGGGICKTATALHEAVKNTGLLETERHNHSETVSYALLGDDASVSRSAGWDYRFKNTHDMPIKITANQKADLLIIQLWEIAPEKEIRKGI